LWDSDDVSETEVSTVRFSGLHGVVQVGAAAIVGMLALPLGFTNILVAGWAGGGGAALGVGVVFFAVVLGLLVGVASLTPAGSRLTRTREGRVGWALIVAVVGTVAGFVTVSAYADSALAFLFSALSYALVAGLLLRQWYLKVGAMAAVVAWGVGLSAALGGTAPARPDELDTRLAAANLQRGEVFVADVPGYHRVPRQLSMMEPDDPRSIPPNRYLTLVAHLDDTTGDCQPHPSDTVLAGAPCTVEQPGLTYTLGVTTHQYFYRQGTVLLQVVGPLAVERAVLRDAIRTARPTAEPGIYTSDVDGYEAMKGGAPLGMAFHPNDKTQLPTAKYLEVSASRVPEADTCATFQDAGVASQYLECVVERPGLHYQRMTDKHVYFAQHGALEVRVTGGLGVDRNLLRDAAVSARPATDEELRTMLP
jgi:hypothetical protein